MEEMVAFCDNVRAKQFLEPCKAKEHKHFNRNSKKKRRSEGHPRTKISDQILPLPSKLWLHNRGMPNIVGQDRRVNLGGPSLQIREKRG
ncbi:hypothetical protein CR513_34502, partial [Mucuna pruriens]